MIQNTSGRLVNFFDIKSDKEIIIESDTVVEVDNDLGEILIAEFPQLTVMSDNGLEDVSEDEEVDDVVIKGIEDDSRYVCSTCDEHFGKGEYSAFRKHLKIHA